MTIEDIAGRRPGGGHRRTASALVAVAVLAGSLILTWLPAGASDAYRRDIRAEVHPGVIWDHVADPGRLALDIAHVAPDAPVRLAPVVSDGQLVENPPGRRLAPTSSMCADAGGVVCVNADFWICPSCGPPMGGVVSDGVPVRSPTTRHRQVTLLDDGRLVTDPLAFDLRLVVTFEAEEQGSVEGLVEEPEPAREQELAIDVVNRRVPDGVALFSPAWATTTQMPEDAVEVTVGGAVPEIGGAGPAEIRGRSGPDSTIPGDGYVLVATGSAREDFEPRLASMAEGDRLELRVAASLPARMSIGGHPVLLRDGEVLPQDPADGKVTNRHPRTLLGWNQDGNRWIVTIDGRQPGRSVGVTLAEATDFLRALGATDAINLDGGGSSTFVTGVPCTDGRAPCIRNVPSDGHERPVTTALALVPTEGTQVGTDPTPAPPPPTSAATTTTAPPTTAPPTTTTTTSPTTTAPTTTAAPTTSTTSTTVEVRTRSDDGEAAIPGTGITGPGISGPVMTGPDQLAAPPGDPPSASRTGPVVVAVLSLVAVAVFAVRVWFHDRAVRARPPTAPGMAH